MKRIYWLVLSALLLGIVYTSVLAQDETNPIIVDVGIYVVGASEFNLDTGTYNVDFYMTMYCSVDCTEDMVGFDVVGINGTESLQVENRVLEGDYAEYRIQATLNQNKINLRRYPFDSHQLNVIVEAKFLLTDELIYQVNLDESGIDEDVQLQGWDLNTEFSAKVVEKTYYDAELGYARFIFTMETTRVPIAAFIRSILPAIAILLISFVGTFMPDRYQRIGLAGGVLLAMLLHHLAVGAEVPPVGYAVYFDAFMLLNDTAILMQFAGTVYELVREKRGVSDSVLDRFSYRMLFMIVLAWILAQVIAWQVFLG